MLCAQCMTQHPTVVEDGVTVLSGTVEASSSSAVEPPQATAEDPQAQSVLESRAFSSSS